MTYRDCGCNSPDSITNWWGFQDAPPLNPLDLVAYAKIGSTIGTFQYSTTFSTPSGSWYTSPFALGGTPICTALGTDNLLKVADAAQWNFQHLTRNSSVNLAPPLQKVIFLRGGLQWQMDIPIDLGAQQYNNLQLSFRDNAGTRGDYAGATPVIDFSPGPFTGVVILSVVLKEFGRTSMGIRAIETGTGKYSMYETEWVVVP